MFVGFVVVDDISVVPQSENNFQTGYVFKSPSWDCVESQIRLMDGSTRTYVGITHGGDIESDTLMMIGHGKGSRYVCSISLDDEHHLIDPRCDDRSILAYMMGQEGARPANHFVDLATVLKAASTYYKNGSLEPSLTWTTW